MYERKPTVSERQLPAASERLCFAAAGADDDGYAARRRGVQAALGFRRCLLVAGALAGGFASALAAVTIARCDNAFKSKKRNLAKFANCWPNFRGLALGCIEAE